MSTEKAIVSERVSISSIWLIPLIALLIGGWMVYQDWANRGTLITLTFSTADGIEAGKTRIRARSVDIGKVESVELNDALNGVIIQARIEPHAEHLLKSDSSFWVVRPRVGTGGVSGLSTLLSGAYIELKPGTGETFASQFIGLEEPPITASDAPGLRLTLLSDDAGSLSVGDSILYRGFTVGRIEAVEFDTQLRQARYSIFIRAPYDNLVVQGSRFWNISGFSLNADADGIRVQTGSIDTILTGGIAFAVPNGWKRGESAKNGETYRLYTSFDGVLDQPYEHYLEYLLMFDQSVRGLKAGAPVEFRGIRVGTVVDLSLALDDQVEIYDPRIPVRIRIEPGRLGFNEHQNMARRGGVEIIEWVDKGLRASLRSGNLLTGSLYVDLDIYPDLPQQPVIVVAGYATLPTTSSGFGALESKLYAILDGLQALPIDKLLKNADTTISSADQLLKELTRSGQQLNRILENQNTQQLPAEIGNTLADLQKTLQTLNTDSPLYSEMNSSLKTLKSTLNQLQPLLKTLNENPNALVFKPNSQPDPIPGASNR